MLSHLDDYEIKRTVWESQVPVEFRIEDSDLGIIRRISQSSYVMLPRVGYFTLYLSKAQLQFLSHYENTATDSSGLTADIIKDNFPNELIRCNSKDVLKNCYIQAIKEADQMKHKGRVANNLTAEESTRLFDGLFLMTSKKSVETEQQSVTKDEEVLLEEAIKKAYPELKINESSFTAISHGIILPFNTPLLWLSINLSYPDNFIHIVLRKRSN